MSSEHPLSIAYFVPNWPPSRVSNGIITYVSNLFKGMEPLGQSVSVISGGERDADDGDQIHRLRMSPSAKLALRVFYRIQKSGPPPGWTMAQAIASTARDLRRRSGLDLIEMEESHGWAELVRRRVKTPILIRLHGPWFLNGEALGAGRDARFHRRVRREGRTLARARKVVAPSIDVLEQTKKYYGLPLDGAEVIPYPIPLPDASTLWAPADCDPDRVLFVGRFDRHKGGDVVIDAFAELAARRPNARMTFVGGDPGFLDDQGRRWSLPEYVAARFDADTASRFEWLGARPHRELDAIRRGSLITIVASRYENFPNVVLEAKALGCPIVASRAGGIPEMIRDGVDGLLFKPGDAADLAAKLDELLGDPARAADFGREGAADARRRFDPVAVAGQMIACYRRVLGATS